MALDVTIIDPQSTPMAAVLGPDMARVCSRLHADHGVRLRTGVAVTKLLGSGRVDRVLLDDGSVLGADTVVIGIGAVPTVAWLQGSGVHVRRGVCTDERGATTVPDIVAVGDCAEAYDPVFEKAVINEHWTNAVEQPGRAMRTLL